MRARGQAKDDSQSVDIDDRMYAFYPPRGTLIYDLWLRMRWLHETIKACRKKSRVPRINVLSKGAWKLLKDTTEQHQFEQILEEIQYGKSKLLSANNQKCCDSRLLVRK